MQRKLSNWFDAQPHTASAPFRLFTFPYAGGGGVIFRKWQMQLAGIDVVAVRLPGREVRISEPPHRSMTALIDALLPEILPLLDRPFAFFGHSMGGLVAYELAHRLRDAGMSCPARLFVSAFRSPERNNPRPALHALPDEGFLAGLLDYGGIPEQLFEYPEILELLLPTLRADFEVLETYVYRPRPPLALPIVGFCGTQDPLLDPEEMHDWADKTSADFTLHRIDGDHFFLASHEGELLGKIAEALRTPG